MPALYRIFKTGAATGGRPYENTMRYDPTLHHRRSIRLQGYDYAQAGAYFVTICTQGRECLFGEIVDGQMRLNEAGKMAWNTWHEMPKHYPRVQIDAFMVMPNHIHGIVILVGQAQAAVECPNTVCVGAAPCGRPETIGQARGLGQARGPDPA